MCLHLIFSLNLILSGCKHILRIGSEDPECGGRCAQGKWWEPLSLLAQIHWEACWWASGRHPRVLQCGREPTVWEAAVSGGPQRKARSGTILPAVGGSALGDAAAGMERRCGTRTGGRRGRAHRMREGQAGNTRRFPNRGARLAFRATVAGDPPMRTSVCVQPAVTIVRRDFLLQPVADAHKHGNKQAHIGVLLCCMYPASVSICCGCGIGVGTSSRRHQQRRY
jgi:hypothetical protein